MNLLIDTLDYAWRDRKDYFVGGNMFLYYSSHQVKNKGFSGPDFLLSWELNAFAIASTGQSGKKAGNIRM